jgi:antitoxin component of RelBE/YafQ-DinJ toxin-antitoxin module
MNTRIQFRIDEETKRLAQLMAEKQGRTLSDACRELTEQLADLQRKEMNHDAWVSEQVNAAFDKLDSGEAVFSTHEQAKERIEARKAKIRQRERNG